MFIGMLIVFANKWRNREYVNKFTIKGNITLSENDILTSAGLKADSLIKLEDINLVFIRDRIAKHPEIKKVVVTSEPPAELVIEIVEKKPIAVLANTNDLSLIDEEKEVFSFKNYDKAFDLPVITGLRTDNQIKYKSDLNIAIDFIKAVYQKGKYVQTLISEVNMSDTTKIIVHTNDKLVSFYFPKPENEKDINLLYKEKLGIFKKFYDTEIAMNNIGYEYIDLRFSNQIVAKLN